MKHKATVARIRPGSRRRLARPQQSLHAATSLLIISASTISVSICNIESVTLALGSCQHILAIIVGNLLHYCSFTLPDDNFIHEKRETAR